MIYCYKDQESVGTEVAAWVQKYKGSSQIITHPAHVEGGEGVKVFCYPPTGAEGDYVLELVSEIATRNKWVEQIPSLRVMRLTGKMVDQAMTFGQWMPSGWLFRTMEEVKAGIDELIYPVYSLSNSGDIRPIENSSEAYTDAVECFKGDGFLLSNGKRQTGYVYFQTVLSEMASSWRVFMFAQKYAIIVQAGSDKVFPMDVLSEQLVELLKYVYAFMLDNSFQWGSVEVLAGADRVRGIRSPFIGSISANWPKNWFLEGGMIFETADGLDWKSTGIPAVRWYSVVAKELTHG